MYILLPRTKKTRETISEENQNIAFRVHFSFLKLNMYLVAFNKRKLYDIFEKRQFAMLA